MAKRLGWVWFSSGGRRGGKIQEEEPASGRARWGKAGGVGSAVPPSLVVVGQECWVRWEQEGSRGQTSKALWELDLILKGFHKEGQS